MSAEDLKNPHDSFFREIMGRVEPARGFLKEYLPARVSGLIDLSSLQIVKDSYVDRELSTHFSDLLYRVRIAGKPAFLYLLFEHKSYVDPLLGFQLLRNMVKIWETEVKQRKNLKRLPVIVPLVLYHGRARWTGSRGSFRSLFEAQSLNETWLFDYVPDFTAEFYDISHIPDEAIRGEVLNRAFLLLLKHIQRPDLFESLPGIFELFNALCDSRDGSEYLSVFLRYLMGTVESGKKAAFYRQVEKTLRKGDTLMPSIAEQIMQEGIEKGIEKGLEKGMEKGMEREKLESARRMIALGMKDEDIRKITGLGQDRIGQLRKKR